jgi:hypothetical protein
MSSDAKDRIPEESVSLAASENQDSSGTPIEGAPCAAQGVPMNLDCATSETPAASKEFELGDYFVCQDWHRPYAAALMETDPVKLATIIAEAERDMASRYLELCLAHTPTSEVADLQNASYALSQIKRAIEIASTQQRYVA